MLSAVDRYAPGPGKKCAIDTLFDVLKAAGTIIFKGNFGVLLINPKYNKQSP